MEFFQWQKAGHRQRAYTTGLYSGINIHLTIYVRSTYAYGKNNRPRLECSKKYTSPFTDSCDGKTTSKSAAIESESDVECQNGAVGGDID